MTISSPIPSARVSRPVSEPRKANGRTAIQKRSAAGDPGARATTASDGSSPRSSSSASSPRAVWKRRAGSFASVRRTTRSTPGGRSPREAESGSGASRAIAAIRSAAVSARNGRRPLAIS